MSDQPQQNPNIQPPYNFDENTVSITDIFMILARQIKVILITPMILCTLTFIYVLFIAKPVYTSTAKIMSSLSGGNTSSSAGLAAQFGIDLPTMQSEPQWVYPEIIKSRTLARAMLKRKFDTQKYGMQKPLLQILTYGDSEPPYSTDTLEILAVNKFISMIELNEERRTKIINLTLSAPEPQFACDLNKAIIEELDTHQREYNKTKTVETKQFVEERIIETKKELQAVEEALRDFRNRNRNRKNSPSLQLEEERLVREVLVITGVFTNLKIQLETSKIDEVKESDYVIVLDPPEPPLNFSKPDKNRMIIIAGFLGIFIGVFIGFLIEYIENSSNETKEEMTKVKSLFLKNILELIFVRSKINK